MLEIIITLFSPKNLQKTCRKTRKKPNNINNNRIKIVGLMLPKVKNLKNFIIVKNAKFKVAKVMSLKTTFKAKFFLTPNAKQVFILLKQMFSKALVFYYSLLKYYIHIYEN